MHPLQRHHHFRWDLISEPDRLAKLEARVVSLLLETQVGDDARDSSVAFELKHQAGVTQCGRILASKRGLDVELAAAGALLHDIYVIVTGSYEDHARRGGPIAEDLLDDVGVYQPAEKDIIRRIVINHSDKHIVSTDPYAEFGKDADVLDCFLYPDALDEYLMAKPLHKVKYYFARAQGVWTELGIPVPPAFKMLDDYSNETWLVEQRTVSAEEARCLLRAVSQDKSVHPFAISKESDECYWLYVSPGYDMPLQQESFSDSMPDSLLESIQHDRITLVWPGLGKYQPLNDDSAKQCGIITGEARDTKADARK